MHQHHKGVAEQLIKLFDEERCENIVLIGQEHILATFRALLPERVREKIKGDLSAEFEEESSSLAQKVIEYLHREYLKEEDTIIEGLIETALARGAGTVGIRDTIEAINRGQVHRLVLEGELKRQGWQCTKCFALGEITTLSCPFCNSAIETVDLAEEMVRSVINRDGGVDMVRDHPESTRVWELCFVSNDEVSLSLRERKGKVREKEDCKIKIFLLKTSYWIESENILGKSKSLFYYEFEKSPSIPWQRKSRYQV
jgi:peptide subunit release factor 1 (eRF1)